jgi:hypothetical protein
MLLASIDADDVAERATVTVATAGQSKAFQNRRTIFVTGNNVVNLERL